tara:strand:- start:11221 stop:11415 length:195 start_codon:yes stop_codon:yes gene_type:complete
VYFLLGGFFFSAGRALTAPMQAFLAGLGIDYAKARATLFEMRVNEIPHILTLRIKTNSNYSHLY